jgi:hypothetical protein
VPNTLPGLLNELSLLAQRNYPQRTAGTPVKSFRYPENQSAQKGESRTRHSEFLSIGEFDNLIDKYNQCQPKARMDS